MHEIPPPIGRTRTMRASGATLVRTCSSAAGLRPRRGTRSSGRDRVAGDRFQQALADELHVVDGGFERIGVARRRLAEAAYFAYELQGGGADLLVGGRYVTGTQGLDASAHYGLKG